MIIAITGPQGCGKTTITNILCAKYAHDNRVYVVPRKTSRSILGEWGVTLDEVNTQPDLSMKFQHEILKRKLNDDTEFSANKIVITERTPIDLAIYTTINLGKYNHLNEEVAEYVEQCIKQTQKHYTYSFLLSTLPFVVNDGVRSVNLFYRDIVACSFDYMFTSYVDQTKWTKIKTDDIERRVSLITNYINQLLSEF